MSAFFFIEAVFALSSVIISATVLMGCFSVPGSTVELKTGCATFRAKALQNSATSNMVLRVSFSVVNSNDTFIILKFVLVQHFSFRYTDFS